MTGQLSLSIVEIIVLMVGAITLGITIHFFIVSRRSLKASVAEVTGSKISRELADWKSRYFNDIELRDKELNDLKQRLVDAEENCNIYSIEADEVRKQNKKLLAEIATLRNAAPSNEKTDYLERLSQAQRTLLEYNEKINEMLGQIDIVKETGEKQEEIIKANEELAGEIEDLRSMLEQKEKEISNSRKKEHITTEMTSMLDNAYNEFNLLQEKIQKLEGQVSASKKTNMDYEDIKEGYYKASRELEEQKLMYNVATAENRELQADLSETEDKLREANFQRQQLQKRVAYLEELNNDMEDVAEANKKLEGQLRRIGELESMLNVVAEERDELARKHSA